MNKSQYKKGKKELSVGISYIIPEKQQRMPNLYQVLNFFLGSKIPQTAMDYCSYGLDKKSLPIVFVDEKVIIKNLTSGKESKAKNGFESFYVHGEPGDKLVFSLEQSGEIRKGFESRLPALLIELEKEITLAETKKKELKQVVEVLRWEGAEMAMVCVRGVPVYSGNYWDFHSGCHGTLIAGLDLAGKWDSGIDSLASVIASELSKTKDNEYKVVKQRVSETDFNQRNLFFK
jgi:hypothetical protein